jgi:FtsP/CotA-like multicopper oxidase with cupredoxin domain
MSRSDMGRILYRGHFREIGIEEDITMIFDHNHLHDYGVQTRHGGNGGAVTPLGISRRALLGGIGGTLATAMLSAKARAAGSAAKRLIAGTRVLEVNGRPARVFGLTGPDGRPGLRLAAGERFRVDLANETGVRTLVHWHGQLPPWMQDGFPWPQTPPIPNGTVESYDYAPIAGTYWMHSHHDMQEQRLLTAPLVVEDAATLREDRQDIVLMLHDFTFRSPDEVLAGLTGTSVADAHALAQRTERAGSDDGGKGQSTAMPTMAGLGTSGMAMPGMNMPGMDMSKAPDPAKGMGMKDVDMKGMGMTGTGMTGAGMAGMDLNDVQYDAFLANDRTLADPEVVRVDRGGRVRLRIINGASSSQFWIDLGDLTGRVVATDGHAVQPVPGRLFPIAMAQRLDILIDLPAAGAFPILARLEGSVRQTGIILATAGARISRIADGTQAAPAIDNSLEARLAAAEPLPARPANTVHTIALGGGMKPYAWSMNGEYWPHVTPLMLNEGQRIEIELVNRTMMAHPIHLHGHVFQVVAIDGRPLRGAVRDTVLVSPGGRVRIAFDADNPGRWAFHCHNLYHMESGMMTEFRYQGIAA